MPARSPWCSSSSRSRWCRSSSGTRGVGSTTPGARAEMSTASVPLGARAVTRRRPPASVRRQRFLVSVANHSLLIASAIAFLAPFAFILLTALMTNDQALSSRLWPHPFRWQNFADVFHQAPILRWTVNTMIYSGLATLGLVLSSVPVAYALARLRWRGRTAAFMVVLIALMLPPQVTVVPLYVMWTKLGQAIGFHFVGSLWPLIIPNWLGDAFSIFLLRQFFLTIPDEYLDAARVDGGDAPRHGAGDRALLPRAARVHRGRHAHGGKGVKVAVVGAGSTYTPELVSGLARERERLRVTELALQDIDAERLGVGGGLARRMLARDRFEGRLEQTGDLDWALDGASFVLIQIRVGGQAARLLDETVPLACGCIGQETTGGGGLAK